MPTSLRCVGIAQLSVRLFAMSYDLYFWRQIQDLQMQPEQVVDRLGEDTPLDGVATFPRTLVREVFRKAFPDIVDGDADLDWEGADSYFHVGFGHATELDVHLISVFCGHSLLKSEETVNQIVDACCSLGCALYDPQTKKRYEQPEPTVQV
jgi:hypothetical protein